jgi:hypothetical protein
MDAKAPGGRQTFDCSAWLAVPLLALEFANALPRALTKRNTARTKQALVYEISQGFFRFCAALPNGSALGISQLTQSLVTQFAEKLRSEREADGKPRYEISTRRKFHGALRSLLDVLHAMERLPEHIGLS